MTSDVRENLEHYLVLALILALGFFLFGYFNYEMVLQRLIAGGVGIAYVLWGVLHHHLTDKHKQ